MTDNPPMDLIADSPWFTGIPQAALAQLAASAVIRSYSRGSYVFTEGEVDADVYCVVTGRLRAAISSSAGHDFAIVDLTQGHWFGEQGLVSSTGRVASVEAMVNSTVLKLPQQAVVQLGDSYPLLYRNLLREHVHSTRRLYELLGALLFYPLRARVARRLLTLTREHGIEQEGTTLLDMKLTQIDFARLALGSRQRVNRVFRDWSERGIVENRGDRLVILDLEALQAEVSPE